MKIFTKHPVSITIWIFVFFHNLINISQLFIPDTNNSVLSDIRFQFTNGWTGIVGRNGSGKTTLAKAIAGIYSNYIYEKFSIVLID